MLSVEERGLLGAQEELRPVGIWPGAADQGDETGVMIMLQHCSVSSNVVHA